jgi:hypothetical protein
MRSSGCRTVELVLSTLGNRRAKEYAQEAKERTENCDFMLSLHCEGVSGFRFFLEYYRGVRLSHRQHCIFLWR